MRRFISFGDEKPVPVPGTVIALIQSKLDEIEVTGGRLAHPFKPGDPVEVIDGPFQGMKAIFYGPTTPTERVQVLLEILGSVNRIQVPVSDLKTASADHDMSVPKRPRRTRGRGRRIRV